MFVHVSKLERSNSFREGDKVSFEVEQDRRTGKSKAENVSVIKAVEKVDSQISERIKKTALFQSRHLFDDLPRDQPLCHIQQVTCHISNLLNAAFDIAGETTHIPDEDRLLLSAEDFLCGPRLIQRRQLQSAT